MSERANVVPISPKADSEPGFPLEMYSDLVVIEQLTKDTSAGGIYLPGDSRKFASGRVVAVGPGRVFSNYMDASGEHKIGHFVPNQVKVGDFVVFGKFQSSEPIEWNGKVYMMCREGDLGGRSISGEPVEIRLAVSSA